MKKFLFLTLTLPLAIIACQPSLHIGDKLTSIRQFEASYMCEPPVFVDHTIISQGTTVTLDSIKEGNFFLSVEDVVVRDSCIPTIVLAKADLLKYFNR